MRSDLLASEIAIEYKEQIVTVTGLYSSSIPFPGWIVKAPPLLFSRHLVLWESWMSMVCSSVRKTNRLIASHSHHFGPCWWPLSRCSMAVAGLAALSQSNLVHSPRLSRIAGAFAWVSHWSWTDFHIFQRTSVGGCYTALSSYILFVNCRSIG